MTSQFELWNNLHRAMMPLAPWYAIIDNQVILELQNKVIHEVLHNRYCLIKWAPMHKQVTLLRKLLSHIFEHYTEVRDDGYISDEDIEQYPEIFMPRPHIMPIGSQEPALLQQPDTPHKSPPHNTEQRLKQDSAVSGEYCSHQKQNQRMNQCHWMMSALRTIMYTSQMTLQTGLKNLHWTDTCAFMMNTKMDVNILDHHPVQIPLCHTEQMTAHLVSCLYKT